ncbi:MAG: hypothetical protein VSS75_030230 [Candidatus Parabeggiatoa sp.]|nr:hypothetical protein [Candidatus Parabeggiatoa sp.]
MIKWKISVIITAILIMTLSLELNAQVRRSNERTLDITSRIAPAVNIVLKDKKNFYDGDIKKVELYLGKNCISVYGELYVRNFAVFPGLLIEFKGKNCDKSCQFEELDSDADRTSFLWYLYPGTWVEEIGLLFVDIEAEILSGINTSVLEILGREYCK